MLLDTYKFQERKTRIKARDLKWTQEGKPQSFIDQFPKIEDLKVPVEFESQRLTVAIDKTLEVVKKCLDELLGKEKDSSKEAVNGDKVIVVESCKEATESSIEVIQSTTVVVQPEEDVLQSKEGAVQPKEDSVQPLEDVLQLEEDFILPEVLQLGEDIVQSKGDIELDKDHVQSDQGVEPDQDVVKPDQDIVEPSQDADEQDKDVEPPTDVELSRHVEYTKN